MYLLLIYLYMISLLDVISYFSRFHISILNRSSERFDLTSDIKRSSHNLWMKFDVTFKEGLIKHIKEIENARFETKSNQKMLDIKVIH